ncbi:hypothetical protein B4U80_14277, partial [Leptotrombidium deliense]
MKNLTNVVICFATNLGGLSVRFPHHGTPYIKFLCDTLKTKRYKEITSILRDVEIHMSKKYYNRDTETFFKKGYQQITEFETFNLSKQFFFFDQELLSHKPDLRDIIFCQQLMNNGKIYEKGFNTKGTCIVIQNINYYKTEYARVGAEHDERRICKLFQELDYHVVILRDVLYEEFMETLRNEIRNVSESAQALFIFVGTNSNDEG